MFWPLWSSWWWCIVILIWNLIIHRPSSRAAARTTNPARAKRREWENRNRPYANRTCEEPVLEFTFPDGLAACRTWTEGAGYFEIDRFWTSEGKRWPERGRADFQNVHKVIERGSGAQAFYSGLFAGGVSVVLTPLQLTRRIPIEVTSRIFNICAGSIFHFVCSSFYHVTF